MMKWLKEMFFVSSSTILPVDVASVLERADWHGPSDSDLRYAWSEFAEDGYEPTDAVKMVFERFAGLAVDEQGAGLECAREPFGFGSGWRSPSEVTEWSEIVGKSLLPVGYLGGEGTLLVDEDCRLYSAWGSEVLLYGGLEEGIDRLVRGLLPKRTYVPRK